MSLVLPAFLQTCGKLGAWLEESVSGSGGVGREELDEDIHGHWHLCGGVAVRAGNMFFSAWECCVAALKNLEIPSS